MNPEEKARIRIDEELTQAGWVIQDRKDFNRNAALGVAVREFMMQDNTEADYLLFIDGKACGVIEAKKLGVSLSGVENQSKGYACHLPEKTRAWQMPLPFIYETNSEEIYFTDVRDVNACSRRVFNFHRPETLLEFLNQTTTLRNNLKSMPALNTAGLRDCQIEAIEGLEQSLANNQKRSLIHMATGAGKTFTACNFVYRLLKFAKAKRVLFLVDRNNLGKQTKKEFDNFLLQDENRKFTEVYIAQHLQHNKIDKDAKVVITTIQRLYSMLCGEEDYDETNEEVSAYEIGSLGKPKEVSYNPQIPPEFFDFVIVDECHRSIYGDWQQVLEYFDAFTIGLTATPSIYTLGYFNKNVVSEYPLERSIIDKVNVDCEIFRIKTKIGEYGSKVESGFTVPVRDKKTRKTIYEQLTDDIVYDKNALDRSVLAPNQIRTVMETYKQAIFTQLFPEREPTWIPKTLIFAKDDNHAEEIVRITREVFGKGNNFCRKITYNIGREKPEEIIKAHRLASGNALKNLSVILAFKHKYLHEIDDSTYIKLIERYIPEMFNKEHKLEYNEPIIIEELSQAYYNTQNKAKAFEILSRAKNNFTKDGNWAESSFINQEIILNGREKNYGKVLEIYNNSDYEVNEDNVLLTIMQSLKEIEGFDSSINFFENNFHRIILDCKKSFDYYLDLSIENGRKTHFYKTMAENKHITARKFFNILSENKEKLELNEKTNQLVELYNELYKTEREYDFDEAAPELVDKSIEIYTKAKNYNILSEQEADDILAKLNKYKSSPSPESYDENIQPIEILMLEKKHPFFKKVVDFLNED